MRDYRNPKNWRSIIKKNVIPLRWGGGGTAGGSMRLNRAMCTQFTAYGARVIEHTMRQLAPNPPIYDQERAWNHSCPLSASQWIFGRTCQQGRRTESGEHEIEREWKTFIAHNSNLIKYLSRYISVHFDIGLLHNITAKLDSYSHFTQAAHDIRGKVTKVGNVGVQNECPWNVYWV